MQNHVFIILEEFTPVVQSQTGRCITPQAPKVNPKTLLLKKLKHYRLSETGFHHICLEEKKKSQLVTFCQKLKIS